MALPAVSHGSRPVGPRLTATPTACEQRYTDSAGTARRFVALPAVSHSSRPDGPRLTATPTACEHRYTDSSWDGGVQCAASRLRTARGPMGLRLNGDANRVRAMHPEESPTLPSAHRRCRGEAFTCIRSLMHSASGLLNKSPQQHGAVDVVILTRFEGHRYAPVDHVERAVPLDGSGIGTEFLAQPETVRMRLAARPPCCASGLGSTSK